MDLDMETLEETHLSRLRSAASSNPYYPYHSDGATRVHPKHPYAANPGTMSTSQMQNIIDLQAAKIESLEKVVNKFNLITDKANG